MQKFCVFCGESPEEKNKEHVLPEWLIKLTGDPNRLAIFGVDYSKDFALRKFRFDSLVFPACKVCNSRFGRLEEVVKPIVVKLVGCQPLSSGDFTFLLDWLDKVRVGLWLGYLYLNTNPTGITPSFHIESRIGRADRMATIARFKDLRDGLTFVGPEFMTYQLSPTCFGLRINGVCIVNASGVSLCSRRLGFPFWEPFQIREDHKLLALPKLGSGRVMNPVERVTRLTKSVSVYQPIFRDFIGLQNSEQYLANEWVSDHTADSKAGYGKIFIQKPESVTVYSEEPSVDWVPIESWAKSEMGLIAQHVHSRMCRDFDASIQLASSQDDRRHLRRHAAMTRMVDNAMLLKVTQQLLDVKQ